MKMQCQNCETVFHKEDELTNRFPDIPDLAQRINPGEPVPIGECPNFRESRRESRCGAREYEQEEVCKLRPQGTSRQRGIAEDGIKGKGFSASRCSVSNRPSDFKDIMSNNLKQKQIHFIGIGGIGISGLARIYLEQGAKVSGSDLVASQTTRD